MKHALDYVYTNKSIGYIFGIDSLNSSRTFQSIDYRFRKQVKVDSVC